MAGNTRGKLKEHFEGIHRNYDWVYDHVQKSLNLIGDKNPELSKAIIAVSEGTKILDEMVQKLYATL